METLIFVLENGIEKQIEESNFQEKQLALLDMEIREEHLQNVYQVLTVKFWHTTKTKKTSLMTMFKNQV